MDRLKRIAVTLATGAGIVARWLLSVKTAAQVAVFLGGYCFLMGVYTLAGIGWAYIAASALLLPAGLILIYGLVRG